MRCSYLPCKGLEVSFRLIASGFAAFVFTPELFTDRRRRRAEVGVTLPGDDVVLVGEEAWSGHATALTTRIVEVA